MGKPRPKRSRPRTGATLLPPEVAAASDVTVADDDAARTLSGILPDSIVRVERAPSGAVTVIWHRPPTEEQAAVAQSILPEAPHAW